MSDIVSAMSDIDPQVVVRALEFCASCRSTKIRPSRLKPPFVFLGMDCEMVETISDNMELARVSIVDSDGRTLLDELILPDHPVEDYRTFVTGITKRCLETRGMCKSVVLAEMDSLLAGKNAILVGHAIQHDLDAMELPRYDLVLDSSFFFVDKNRTHSLVDLVREVLHDDMSGRIERGGSHSSVEDAADSMRVVLKTLKVLNSSRHQLPFAMEKFRVFRKFASKAFNGDAKKFVSRVQSAESGRKSGLPLEFLPPPKKNRAVVGKKPQKPPPKRAFRPPAPIANAFRKKNHTAEHVRKTGNARFDSLRNKYKRR